MSTIREDPRSDVQLVGLCNDAGAKEAAEAFEALYRRHRSFVLRVAMRFSKDRDIALDALQETFCYLLRKFPPEGEGLELTARLTSLLYPVAKHYALDMRRKSDRFTDADSAPEPHSAPAHGTDDIAGALAGLAPERREVLMLRFVDGLTMEEIAAALGIPVGTVKSRTHLAIRQLRDDPKTRDFFLEP